MFTLPSAEGIEGSRVHHTASRETGGKEGETLLHLVVRISEKIAARQWRRGLILEFGAREAVVPFPARQSDAVQVLQERDRVFARHL
jgi:hypothetical protein